MTQPVTPCEQCEANTARILVQNETIVKLLTRLLETVGEQPDYSGANT